MKRKFLYLRVGTATASEDDEATGSNIYPVENVMGMCSGTSNAAGAITDDDDAVSLFLKPIRKTQTAEGDNADANPDVIVLACAQYGQKAVMRNLVSAINAQNISDSDGGMITLYDGYADKPASDPTTSIVGVTGITIVSQLAAAD